MVYEIPEQYAFAVSNCSVSAREQAQILRIAQSLNDEDLSDFERINRVFRIVLTKNYTERLYALLKRALPGDWTSLDELVQVNGATEF